MTRILLVDDHPVVRQGIKQVLSGAFDPALVGEADNAEEGLSEVRTTEWDVMVLDLTLPGMSGLDLLKDLRREHPDAAGARPEHASARPVCAPRDDTPERRDISPKTARRQSS